MAQACFFGSLLSSTMFAASSSARAWDRPHEFERYGEHADAADSDDEPSQSEASQELADFLVYLKLKGKLSARDICVIAYWGKLAGLVGAAAELAKSPDAQSGKYQAHLDKVLKINDAIVDDEYILRVPGYDKYGLTREIQPVPVLPCHEALQSELDSTPDLPVRLRSSVEGHEWTQSYTEHPLVREFGTHCDVYPCALYIDGVAFQKRDGLIGFYIYNLITEVRHLCTVLRKSSLCKCGCGGWCSIYCVFKFNAWSFEALARGQMPHRRHDASDFDSTDQRRSCRAGASMLRAALVQIRGDWAEYAHTFAFPTWASYLHPCFICNCSRDELGDVGDVSVVTPPRPEKTHEDYNAACVACEHWVMITSAEQHAILVGTLFFDRRSQGSRGYALQRPIPELGLLAGDRLEPNENLWDIALFDEIHVFPVWVQFWRPANQTHALHRNPLFNARLGITLQLLAIDPLHTLHLGVFKEWTMHALWLLIRSNAWGVDASNAEVLRDLSTFECRHELFGWYKTQRSRRGGAHVYELQDLAPSMIGTQSKPKLNTKAAETATLMEFCVHVIRSRLDKCGQEGVVMLAAGESFVGLLTTMRENPRVMSPAANQALVDYAMRGFILYRRAGYDTTPKFHLMLHMVPRAHKSGNPYYHTTFVDEGYNGDLARVAAACHRTTWYRRVLGGFRWAFSRPDKKPRQRR